MRLDLELMGFDRNMVIALFDHEAVIEDSNHAVELLIKGPNGWIHNFVLHHNSESLRDKATCKICAEPRMEHMNERRAL